MDELPFANVDRSRPAVPVDHAGHAGGSESEYRALLKSLGPVRQRMRREALHEALGRGPLTISRAGRFVLRPGIRLHLARGPAVTVWLYRSLDVVPLQLLGFQWLDTAGWVLRVIGDDGQPALAFGWRLRIDGQLLVVSDP